MRLDLEVHGLCRLGGLSSSGADEKLLRQTLVPRIVSRISCSLWDQMPSLIMSKTFMAAQLSLSSFPSKVGLGAQSQQDQNLLHSEIMSVLLKFSPRSIYLFFKIYLFIFRERGGRKRERNINQR